jgi:hypothetical protein
VNATYIFLIWEFIDRAPVDDVPPKVRRIMQGPIDRHPLPFRDGRYCRAQIATGCTRNLLLLLDRLFEAGGSGNGESLMRIPALVILTISTVLTGASARAQTYSPDYPVCLQTYGINGGYIECGYTSLAQCGLSASGRAGQCINNPYFAAGQVPAGALYRRHRRVY